MPATSLPLRIEPYIELIWAQVKSYVGRNNKTFKLAEVKSLLEEGIRRITANEWAKCVDHVIREEEKMMSLDGLIDDATTNTTTPFIINVGSNSESSESVSDKQD